MVVWNQAYRMEKIKQVVFSLIRLQNELDQHRSPYLWYISKHWFEILHGVWIPEDRFYEMSDNSAWYGLKAPMTHYYSAAPPLIPP